MNKLLRPTLLALATLATPLFAGTAYATDLYVGVSRTTPGEASTNFPAAKNVENYNSPASYKLYGGIDLTERYSVELGYGAFGSYKMADPSPGAANESRLSAKVMYVAGKASMPLGEAFSLFGKVGLAANKFSWEGNLPQPEDGSYVRPMLGFGVSYNFTPHAAAVLEYNFYGQSKGYRQQKLELGLKYAF